MANNLVAARNAIAGLETVNAFLALHPIGEDGVDPLTVSTTVTTPDGATTVGQFGYTEEEAKLIREVFGKLEALKPQIGPVFEQAIALTGLS
jgi:hypothetical protein